MPGVAPTAVAQRLLRWQTYQEASWGASGAATSRWMTLKPYPELKPYRKSTIYDEARGSLAPGFVSSQLRRGGEWKLGGYGTYEDLPYYLNSIFAAVSGASIGGGFNTYTYTGPTTAQPSLASYTVEYNQTSYQARALGCIGQKLTLKGEAEKWLEWDLNGLAQDVDNTWSGSLATLSDRTVTPVIVPVEDVYLDASGSSAIGTNKYANTLLGFTLNFDNMLRYIYTGGALTPQNWVIGSAVKADLELDLLYTAAVRNFINTYMFANVDSLVQLKFTSGSNGLTINFAGEMTEDPALFGNKEGAQSVKIKLGALYNAGAALYNNVIVQSAVSVMP